MKVCVLGAYNVDIAATPFAKFVPCDSNPGKVNVSFGGVGRNIAHNLCLLGEDVEFLTAIGGDAHAQELKKHCSALGMDLSHALLCPDEASSTYLCIHDEKGDMVAAVADMALAARVTKEYVRDVLPVLNAADAVVFDTNLEEETIAYLLEHCTAPMFADTVSCHKAEKLRPSLLHKTCRIHTLKTNRVEAEILWGASIKNNDDILSCAKFLHEGGVQNVFITLGSDGLLCYNGSETVWLECLPVDVVSATGAGDSFLAALVFAFGHNADLTTSAKMGRAIAAMTLTSPDAVCKDISAEKLMAL